MHLVVVHTRPLFSSTITALAVAFHHKHNMVQHATRSIVHRIIMLHSRVNHHAAKHTRSFCWPCLSVCQFHLSIPLPNKIPLRVSITMVSYKPSAAWSSSYEGLDGGSRKKARRKGWCKVAGSRMHPNSSCPMPCPFGVLLLPLLECSVTYPRIV